MRAYLIVGAFVVAFLVSVPAFSAQRRAVYHPIPPGYDFPADKATLLAFVDNGNTSALRKHVWMVWAGLTQPTETGEAIWETWWSAAETFATGPQPQGVRTLQRRFRKPRQFVKKGLHPEAPGTSLLSFTLFNDDTRTFIRENRFNSGAHLDELNAAFPAGTAPAARTVKEFPNAAMSLKTVWWIVKKTGFTSVPVWDPELNPPTKGAHPFQSWKRSVVVDPSGAAVPQPGKTVVPLAQFYSFVLTPDVLPFVHSAGSVRNAQTAAAGDYAVLVAMHVTTKEIPQWVWATFWWHDKPGAGPFAADRPSSVTGVWRNYLMSTTYNMDKPPAPDNGPPIAFNPWLEGPLSDDHGDGIRSNCMSCHQQAAWPSDGSFAVTRGTIKPDDPLFANKIRTDFLWSMIDEAGP